MQSLRFSHWKTKLPALHDERNTDFQDWRALTRAPPTATPFPKMADDSYYLDMHGSTAGPFSLAEVAALYHAGSVTDATLYTKPQAVQWLPLATILPLLAAALPSAQPPPILIDEPPARPLARPGDVVCLDCECVGRRVNITPGSFVLEVLCYLFFCLPGLLYTVWRHTSGYSQCAFGRRGTRLVFDRFTPSFRTRDISAARWAAVMPAQRDSAARRC